MRFFWKIFFTTMFVSVACSALGGYILINSNFHALLDNEVQTAYDYGDIVYYSLTNELKDLKLSSPYLVLGAEDETGFETLGLVAQSININSMNHKISFGIMASDGNVIFSSLPENFAKTSLSSLERNQKVWTLKKTAHSIYVQAIRPATFREISFYLETIRDVTFIFDNQKYQYEMLLRIMIGMLLLAGLVTLVISKLLMRRVVSLTKATQSISAGNLGKRVAAHGDDEFAVLSQNFNRMADDLEEKIYELQDEAEKKELFVGAFSHELKTPLTSIIGYADMLRRKRMDKEQLHFCAEYIFAEGQRLETLSMRLLDLIILKKREVHFVPVELGQLMTEVCSVLLPQLKKSNIELLWDMEDGVLKLEPELMKTVFINLIDNGRNAIDANGQILIRGTWQQDIYTVSICDTGKGMEEQELTKIKKAFYMVDKSRSRKQGGTGLGLALCDEILKLHGFGITFESMVNAGTTVTVTMKGEKNE